MEINQTQNMKANSIEEMRRALKCLYLEVHESIAEDVSRRFEAVVSEWQQSQQPEPIEDIELADKFEEEILKKRYHVSGYVVRELAEELTKIASLQQKPNNDLPEQQGKEGGVQKFMDKIDPFEPVCKKHGYRGYNCMQCYHEKYVVVEREKYIAALSVLKTVLEKLGLDAGVEAALSYLNELKN